MLRRINQPHCDHFNRFSQNCNYQNETSANMQITLGLLSNLCGQTNFVKDCEVLVEESLSFVVGWMRIFLFYSVSLILLVDGRRKECKLRQQHTYKSTCILAWGLMNEEMFGKKRKSTLEKEDKKRGREDKTTYLQQKGYSVYRLYSNTERH